jgi:superfamily I DNA/RNA helicase
MVFEGSDGLPISVDTTNLSKYQIDILKTCYDRLRMKSKKPGILVQAYAGCGKSFTLTKAAEVAKSLDLTPSTVKLVVFGKKNQKDLSEKLSKKLGASWGKSATTLHSLGYYILKQCGLDFEVDQYKYEGIAKDLKLIGRSGYRPLPGIVTEGVKPLCSSSGAFINIIDKIRVYCLEPTPENISLVASRHKISINSETVDILAGYVKTVLEIGLEQAFGSPGCIDYTDMLWLVWRCEATLWQGIQSCRTRYKFLALDEAQDTDPSQLHMIKLLVDPDECLFLGVGDRYQSVYEFRGCVTEGMDTIKETFSCTDHVLPINYRCGTNHIELVRKVFPHIGIQAHPNAVSGMVSFIGYESLFEELPKSGKSLGLCRNNAYLLGVGIQLLLNGIPVNLKGDNLANRIVSLVRTIDPKYSPATFIHKAKEYLEKEKKRIADLEYSSDEDSIKVIKAKVEALCKLFYTYEPLGVLKDFDGWQNLLNTINKKSEFDAPVDLCTIHTAKGAEADTVFLMGSEDLRFGTESPDVKGDCQEWNLLYVALTRSTDKLLILKDSFDKPPEWVSGKVERKKSEGFMDCFDGHRW